VEEEPAAVARVLCPHDDGYDDGEEDHSTEDAEQDIHLCVLSAHVPLHLTGRLVEPAIDKGPGLGRRQAREAG